MRAEDFIFEICVEELPARFIPIFEREIAQCATHIFEREMLTYHDIAVLSTPRRIGIYVHQLAYMQGTKEEEAIGPPATIAWNEGRPTPALEGFLKKYGLSCEDIYTKQTGKGEYIASKYTVGGKETKGILSDICYEIIIHLSSIQKMHWGNSTVVFARPLTSILALYGSEEISVTYGACHTTSPQVTYGHRILCNNATHVQSASHYFKCMEEAKVIPFSHLRKEMILQGIATIEKEKGAHVVYDEALLEENINLCEYPFVLLGDVDSSYLSLPREVFLTTIQSHQRSFGLANNEGKLLPHFITITNNPYTNKIIKAGWERVLKARLEDAHFFYAMDSNAVFEDWLEQLENVTFITSLGSMKERALRIQALSAYLAHLLIPAMETEASQAGLLCKADLVSAVVKEFDSLQGIMGGIYAKEKGKGEAIATAIAEHYLPLGPSASVPSTQLGSIIALADKIDMVIGCFSIGMIPTGTTDTQGIRRAVLGIIRIILEYTIDIDFKEAFLYSRSLYGVREWKLREEEMLAQLSTFFSTRIKQYFLSLGFSTICIDAVLDIEDSLPALYKRVEALQDFIQYEKAKEVCMIFKRVSNIVDKERTHHIATEQDCNTALFQNKVEQDLYDCLVEVLPLLRADIAEHNYKASLEKIDRLYLPLQSFFDGVLVLDENPEIRANRILLLNAILSVLERIANFRELQL